MRKKLTLSAPVFIWNGRKFEEQVFTEANLLVKVKREFLYIILFGNLKKFHRIGMITFIKSNSAVVGGSTSKKDECKKNWYDCNLVVEKVPHQKLNEPNFLKI